MHLTSHWQQARARGGAPGLLIEGGEVAFGVDGGGAAHAGSGHRLAVDLVGAIAGDEDTGNVGLSAFGRNDVAGVIHGDDAFEELRIGNVANGDEETGAIEEVFLAGLEVLDPNASDFVLLDVEHLGDN